LQVRVLPGAPTDDIGSFRRTLRAEDKSERTVKSYTEAVRLFADFLAERHHPLTINAITRDDVRAFVPTSWSAGSPSRP
jgi:site-specific recombinase XerD